MSQIEFVISWLFLAGNRMCCSIVQTNIGVTVAAAAMVSRPGKRLCNLPVATESSLLMRSHSEVLCIRSEDYSFGRELFAALSCRTNQHVRCIPVTVLDTNPKMKLGMKVFVTAIVG